MIILLCKDENARQEAERMFSLQGKINHCFFKPLEALECLQREKGNYLEVLIDFGMPNEEGFGFLREIVKIVRNGQIMGTYFTNYVF